MRKYHLKLAKAKAVKFSNRTHVFERGLLKELPREIPAKCACDLCAHKKGCPDYHASKTVGFMIVRCERKTFLDKHFSRTAHHVHTFA